MGPGVICGGGGGGGGGVHTNSFAMIMFCVFVGAVYMLLVCLRLFMGLPMILCCLPTTETLRSQAISVIGRLRGLRKLGIFIRLELYNTDAMQ